MRWACDPRAASAALAAAVAASPGAARADSDPEPTYGRLAGDVTLIAGAGSTVASGGVRAEGELRARYLDSAGLFASYEDGPIVGSSVDPRRVLAAGLELRPLFLARWLEGLESRRARLDLVVDSIGIEIGATLPQSAAQPAGASFASRPGLQTGIGVEVPLVPGATGPWIAVHGGVRWSDEALARGEVLGRADREAYVTLTVAWHQVVAAHAVDFGDRAPE